MLPPVTVSAQGGNGSIVHGGGNGGGGGGGGLVDVFYNFSASEARSQVTVMLDGGGSPFNNGSRAGQTGFVYRSGTQCEKGKSGPFCQDCPAGSYVPSTNTGKCTKCAKGQYSAKQGLVTCTGCAPGMFNVEKGATACQPCPPGKYGAGALFNNATNATEGGTSCKPCGMGYFSSTEGVAACVACPAGKYQDVHGDSERTGCTPCPVDSWGPMVAVYTTENGSLAPSVETSLCNGFDLLDGLPCCTCPTKPAHSSPDWVNTSVAESGNALQRECAYKCWRGYSYSNKQCLNPLDAIVGRVGGVAAFCCIVVVGLTVLFYCWKRFIGGPLNNYLRRRRTKNASVYEDSQSSDLMNLDEALNAVTNHHSLQLQDIDLPRHRHRLYFCGDNTIQSPWVLPPNLGNGLGQMVYPGKFSQFAVKCNAQAAAASSRWYLRGYQVMLVLCWPFAMYMQHYIRCLRLRNIQQYIAGYKHGFMRSSRSRALQDSFKFGCSPDMTLAYIDILSASQAEGQETATKGRAGSVAVEAARPRADSGTEDGFRALQRTESFPALLRTESLDGISNSLKLRAGSWDPQVAEHDLLPMLLPCSGDGTFDAPCVLDCNDVLVRAVPSRLNLLLDSEWQQVVADLNQKLRVIDPSHFSQTVKPTLDFIVALNRASKLEPLELHLVHNQLHDAERLFETNELPCRLPRDGKLGVLITMRSDLTDTRDIGDELHLKRTVWVRSDEVRT